MRVSLTILAAALLSSACAPNSLTTTTATSSARDDVRSFEAEVMQSYNAGDAEAAARHYAPDAFVFIPGQELRTGRDEIRANISRFMADPNFALAYENERLDVAASNDLAYSRGLLTVSYTDPATDAVRTIQSHYLLVMRRDPNDGWQVVQDISF
ncbi:YybH family protein [Parapontixanthobacter aurantiacus]|nr:DUF4440 domain-containing protein [Parapontixanthobacter aurantiacus]